MLRRVVKKILDMKKEEIEILEKAEQLIAKERELHENTSYAMLYPDFIEGLEVAEEIIRVLKDSI